MLDTTRFRGPEGEVEMHPLIPDGRLALAPVPRLVPAAEVIVTYEPLPDRRGTIRRCGMDRRQRRPSDVRRQYARRVRDRMTLSEALSKALLYRRRPR
jgi:hypothetical protein